MLEPFSFDNYLLAMFIQQLPDYKWFFFIITQLGSPFTLTVLASLGFVLGKSRMKVFSAILVIGLLFSMVVVDDVKELAQRQRPDGARAADFLIMDSYSFPSGHAFSIFLAASVLGAYFGWKLYAAGYVMAIAVSLSRLYLGVHYPSDIVVGAMMGIIMGEMLVFAAYRLGLCDNIGLLSLVRKTATKTAPSEIKGPGAVLSISIFLTIIISVISYFLNDAALAIFVLTTASMFIIFYVISSRIQCDKKLLTIFAIMAICLIASISMLFMGAFILSLIAIAIAYFATIAITYGKNNAIKKI